VAGKKSAWKQEELEARKMLENAADSLDKTRNTIFINGLLMNDLQHDKTDFAAFRRSSKLSYLANGLELSRSASRA
jgi:hypothetical protein